jgi:hypothetical protein
MTDISAEGALRSREEPFKKPLMPVRGAAGGRRPVKYTGHHGG